jgi:hypothetical protein
MTQKRNAAISQIWRLCPQKVLLLLLFVFTLQSIFWFGEHLAVDEHLNQQKLEIDSLRLEVLKLAAKVEESDIRVIRHEKWLEDHLNTFNLLQRQKQEQGNDQRLTKKEGKEQRASNIAVDRSKKLAGQDAQTEDNHVKMVVGILSAKRQTPTVLKMVQKLVRDLNMNQFKVVVWQSLSSAHDLVTKMELQKLGVTVESQVKEYEELKPDAQIPITLGDKPERIRWRTNHVLDYANLLELCLKLSSSQYILILEDDLLPAKQAIEKSYAFAHENFASRTDWGFLTLYSGNRRQKAAQEVTDNLRSGGVSMLYKRDIVVEIIPFLRKDPFLAPVDLMIPELLVKQKKLLVFERSPNLFQHIGASSTYTGRDQKERKSETWRSASFMRDETNLTHQGYPVEQKTRYIGCFGDNTEDRDLDGLFATLADKKHSGSVHKCALFCHDYFYYGLQNGGECLCGNQFGLYGKADESKCDKTCSDGNPCGGENHNSIYKALIIQSKYLGCYKDDHGDRDFDPKGLVALKGKESIKECSLFCYESSSQYLALQYGGECYCGNTFGKHGKAEQDGLCDMPCSRDKTVNCGGNLFNSVYQITIM